MLSQPVSQLPGTRKFLLKKSDSSMGKEWGGGTGQLGGGWGAGWERLAGAAAGWGTGGQGKGMGSRVGRGGRCCCRLGLCSAAQWESKGWSWLFLPPAPPNETSGCKCSPWAGPPAKELIKGHFGHKRVLPGAHSSLQHTVVPLGTSYLTLTSSLLCFIF